MTGGIACGKTVVTDYLESLGAGIVDADLITRRLYEPGSGLLKEIFDTFGYDFQKEDGSLDRSALRREVFGSREKLELLNSMTHPAIGRAVFSDMMASSSKSVVLSVPLLLETGMDVFCDEVWVIYSSPKKQLERLLMRDGISEELALSMIQSQMSFKQKKMRADRIINNNGSLKRTFRQTKRYYRRFSEGSI